MALSLNQSIKDKLKEDIIQQQIIVEIDGIDYVFGTNHVTAPIKIGDNIKIGDEDFFINGNRTLENSLPLIDHTKTTRSISQRISETEGISSISSMNLGLIDEDGLLSSEFSPTENFDILGSKATVYASFIGGAHPDDSIVIFRGIIGSIKFNAANVELKIIHPEKLKQQALFVKTETVLEENIDANVTEFAIEFKPTLLQPNDTLEGYVRINDEIIQYELFQSGDLKNCTRGSLNTIASSHEAGDTVETFYVIKGNPIDLALKLLLSRNYDKAYDSWAYAQDIPNFTINQLSAEEYIQNAVIFKKETLEGLNIIVGDEIRIKQGPEFGQYPSQNIITQTNITSIGENESYKWFVVDKPLLIDNVNTYSVDFTSQYARFTDGCQVDPDFIDIEGFRYIQNLYSNQMVDCEIYIKDTIEDAKSFIDRVILRPQGLLSVPRKGRISINKTSAPLADNNTVTLNKDNITNAKNLGSSRDIDSGFYNSVIFKTNLDSLEDKFLRTDIFADLESETKIKVGKRPLVIEASSLRDNENTRRFIQIQAENLLATYKFGAEKMTIDTDYATGIPIEVGDSVICDLSGLNVTDISIGSKDYVPRIMRVINKTLDLIGNKVSLNLESTIFKSQGRYGTISPSSFINSGSTTTLLNLSKSFGNKLPTEKEKWTRYVGQKIRVKSRDWSFSETVTLKRIDSILDQIEVSELSQMPQSGWVITPPKYDESDPVEMALWKNLHVFLNPSVSVVSGIDSFNFTVSALDIDKFLEKAIVKLQNTDRSVESVEAKVLSINGNQISVDTDLGFTPDNTFRVQLIGFKDGGLPYRIL